MERGYHRVISGFLLPELSTIVLSYLRVTFRPLLSKDGKELPKIGEGVKEPDGILFSREGDIVVVYLAEGFRVVTYSLDGEIKRCWSYGDASPSGIAELSNGDLVISDYCHNRVMIFNREGFLLKQWGGRGSQGGKFNQPRGVTILPGDVIAVCDSCNERVQMFTREGDFLRQHVITSLGCHAYKPIGIASLMDGGFVTTSSLADGSRVRIFDEKGELTCQWGEYESQDDMFRYPTDVAVLSHGEIIVADSWNGHIQAYTPDGKYLCQWGYNFAPMGVAARGNMVAVSVHDVPHYIQVLCLCLDIVPPEPPPILCDNAESPLSSDFSS